MGKKATQQAKKAAALENKALEALQQQCPDELPTVPALMEAMNITRKEAEEILGEARDALDAQLAEEAAASSEGKANPKAKAKGKAEGKAKGKPKQKAAKKKRPAASEEADLGENFDQELGLAMEDAERISPVPEEAPAKKSRADAALPSETVPPPGKLPSNPTEEETQVLPDTLPSTPPPAQRMPLCDSPETPMDSRILGTTPPDKTPKFDLKTWAATAPKLPRQVVLDDDEGEPQRNCPSDGMAPAVEARPPDFANVPLELDVCFVGQDNEESVAASAFLICVCAFI